MTDGGRRLRLGAGTTLLLALLAGAHAGAPDYRLVAASADGHGGGISQAATYTVVLAVGQPDAQLSASGGVYAFAGGVFAALPNDRLFRDGFESL